MITAAHHHGRLPCQLQRGGAGLRSSNPSGLVHLTPLPLAAPMAGVERQAPQRLVMARVAARCHDAIIAQGRSASDSAQSHSRSSPEAGRREGRGLSDRRRAAEATSRSGARRCTAFLPDGVDRVLGNGCVRLQRLGGWAFGRDGRWPAAADRTLINRGRTLHSSSSTACGTMQTNARNTRNARRAESLRAAPKLPDCQTARLPNRTTPSPAPARRPPARSGLWARHSEALSRPRGMRCRASLTVAVASPSLSPSPSPPSAALSLLSRVAASSLTAYRGSLEALVRVTAVLAPGRMMW